MSPPVAKKKPTTRKRAGARRPKTACKTAAPVVAEGALEPSDAAPSPAAIAAYRTRMRLVGDLLRTAFDDLPDRDHPDRVGHGAYLGLMGQVFEALDGLSQVVPVDDLVKLSKVVAEQRRAETNARKVRCVPDGDDDPEATQADDFETRKLPPHFGELVRQIYGTSLAEDVIVAADRQEHSEAGE